MVIDSLSHEQVHAHFDVDSAIAYITYYGQIEGAASEAAYTWLTQVINAVGVENLYGEIFDFRAVTQFTTENLIGARKHSRRFNLKQDTRQFPVALIVANAMQEEILRGPMRVVPENTRKRIVHSQAEARAFLDEWNRAHGG